MLIRDRSMVELSLLLEEFVSSLAYDTDVETVADFLAIEDTALYEAAKGGGIVLDSPLARGFEEYIRLKRAC